MLLVLFCFILIQHFSLQKSFDIFTNSSSDTSTFQFHSIFDFEGDWPYSISYVYETASFLSPTHLSMIAGNCTSNDTYECIPIVGGYDFYGSYIQTIGDVGEYGLGYYGIWFKIEKLEPGVIFSMFLESSDYQETNGIGICNDCLGKGKNYAIEMYPDDGNEYDDEYKRLTIDVENEFHEIGWVWKSDGVEYYIDGEKIFETILPLEKMKTPWLALEFIVSECWTKRKRGIEMEDSICWYGDLPNPLNSQNEVLIKRIRHVEGVTGYPSLHINENDDDDDDKKVKIITISISSVVGGTFLMVILVVFIYLGYRYSKRKGFKKIERGSKLDLIEEKESKQAVANFNIDKSLFCISIDDLDVKRSIGKGGFCVVYYAIWNKIKVAFKAFQVQFIFDTTENFELFEKELNLMSSLSYKHLVQFYGAVMAPPRVGIVMEFCQNGSIKDYLTKNKLSIKEKRRILKEIALGVNFLHSKNIVHRDLKPENIMLSESLLTVKLIDFGLSRVIDKVNKDVTKNIGSNGFMAPEVFLGDEYDYKVDCYSFGIIVWCILCNNFNPYGGRFSIQGAVATKNLRPKVDEIDSDVRNNNKDLINLMTTCWQTDPKLRYPFNEILSKFFQTK